MRVSTSMIFHSGTSGIQDRQSDLFKVQNQLSTGRRILSPEDDPIGASEALAVSQAKGVNSRFLENQADAKSKLNFLDTTLGAVSDELQSFNERAIQAGNASYSPAQRAMIGEELKQRMADLIGLANTKDGTGLYIFAGYKTSTQPFQLTGAPAPHQLGASTYASYAGDSGQQSLQVTSSKEIATSENGMDVFMQVKNAAGNATGRSLFDGLQNLVDILDGTQPFTQAAYAQALGDVTSSIDHIGSVRASVGARLQAVTSLTSTGEDIGFLYDSRLSELQDLDYTAAISKFSQTQMQLEAAQLSFKQSSQLSLFNIL